MRVFGDFCDRCWHKEQSCTTFGSSSVFGVAVRSKMSIICRVKRMNERFVAIGRLFEFTKEYIDKKKKK